MKHWSQIEERGIIWGMRFLLQVYTFLGNRTLQWFLYPIVSYFWLMNKNGRKASREFLGRISSYVEPGRVSHSHVGSYLHFISFANAIIDKLAAWSGALPLDNVEFYGRDLLLQHIDQGKGILILGSHLGNLEVCRTIGHLRKCATINVLVHTLHAQKFNHLLKKYADDSPVNLIQVTEINAATAMLLEDKINAGELLVIAADRTPVEPKSRVSEAQFLGTKALFPQGPMILASLLRCPVYTLFCLKQGGRFVIYFEQFRDSVRFSRKHREQEIQACIQDYANRLQSYCIKEPLQWFNFYDFWQRQHG